MPRGIVGGLFVAAVLSLGVPVSAQETFDAAAIKRSKAGDATDVVPAVFLPGGRWSAHRATLSMILRSAYGLPSNRILGMPVWANSERFDIVAKAASNTALQQMQVMAQQLLAERFGLRAHVAQRVTEVYALVRAKASGALGPGLRPSTASCQSADASGGALSARIDSIPCREEIKGLDGGARRYQWRDRPLTDFLIMSGARTEIGDPVVDRSGLTGRFDIDLEFAPQSAILGRTTPEIGVSLAVAVVDQLGLRFERRREPFDVLVIEHVTMPSFD